MKAHLKRTWFMAGAGALAVSVAVGLMAGIRGDPRAGIMAAAPAAGQPIAIKLAGRGDYLVNQVAMCADCHTPMGRDGQRVKTKWLQGAKIAFRPDFPVPHWSSYAPDIAGLPSHWTAAAMIKFLRTGRDPQGRRAQPPMPAFRFNRADALAVTAYLKGLPHGK